THLSLQNDRAIVINVNTNQSQARKQPLSGWGLQSIPQSDRIQRKESAKKRHRPLDAHLTSSGRSKAAERAGFEPAVQVYPAHRFSKPAHSTTLPPLRHAERTQHFSPCAPRERFCGLCPT